MGCTYLPAFSFRLALRGAWSFCFAYLPAFSFRQALRGRYRFVSRFYQPRSAGDDLRWPYLSLREERYGRKTRQRAPKPPFGIWLFYTGVRRGDVLTSYGFAVMHFTRFRPVRRRAGGVRFTRLRRKARHHLFSAISLPKALLPPDSIVLLQLRRKRQHFKNTQPDL